MGAAKAQNRVMSDISDRYFRLAHEFSAQVNAVAPQAWQSPSPCAGWTASDVLEHVVQTQHNLAAYVDRDLAASRTGDPVKDWALASEAMHALLEDPATAAREFTGLVGPTTLEDTANVFACFDLIIHRWDIARATGGDEHIDVEDVRWVQRQANNLGDAIRSPGGFAAAIDPPPGADEKARLLAFLGRVP